MADGGLLPWRRQKPDGMVYETYEDLFKPLPPPPPGKAWRRMRLQPGDRDEAQGVATRWELVDRPSSLRDGPSEEQECQAQEATEQGDPDFIEHVVLKTDTMAGLRLRYKVTAAELRRYNDFFGEQFKCCTVLRVPRKGKDTKSCRQLPSREVLRQQFRNATKCNDEHMVTYYLEWNEWDVSRAVAEFHDDKHWEEAHSTKSKGKKNKDKRNNRPPAPPSLPYTPPPVLLGAPSSAIVGPPSAIVGPPPSYRSLFGSRFMGRPSPSTHELSNVVSSSPSPSLSPSPSFYPSPFTRLPSPFRSASSPKPAPDVEVEVDEEEAHQPLLTARVVEHYDMRPQKTLV